MSARINNFLLYVGLFLLVFSVRLLVIDNYASWVPFFDDWGMGGTLAEYKTGELSLSFLLKPFNGHLGLWREFLQIGIFHLNDFQWDTRLQMVVNALIWSVTAIVLVAIIRTFFDKKVHGSLVLFVLLLWLFPTSLINATWGVQTHSYNMMLMTILALVLITAPAYSRSWWCGLFFAWAATLTMGGGSLIAPTILGITILRLIFGQAPITELKATLIATAVLSVYCIALLKYSSSGHGVYYATTFQDFITVFLKCLSYPLSSKVWPGIVFMMPCVVLGWLFLVSKTVHGRAALFALKLAAFQVVMALTIAYARGVNGWDPSDRYYEFFGLQLIAALFSLVLIGTVMRWQFVWRSMSLIWLLCMLAGAFNQVDFFSDKVAERARYKPLQESAVRDYLLSSKSDHLYGLPEAGIPFASREGLVAFIKKVDAADVWAEPLQVPSSPTADKAQSDKGFETNGSVVLSQGGGVTQYRGEDVVGSFVRSNGGMRSTGKFVSEEMLPVHAKLAVPVTGYIGFQDLKLELVDSLTSERRSVVPKDLSSAYSEIWRLVEVDAPDNPFRLEATDMNPKLWFAFAAPRGIGAVSVISNRLIEESTLLFQLSLILVLLGIRRKILHFVTA